MAPISAGMKSFETDSFGNGPGDLKITFIGHASLLFQAGGKTVHVDPFGEAADYALFPKADLILLTHDHYDHMDPEAIAKISKPATIVIETRACADQGVRGVVMKNGETRTELGIQIEAVPAYNLVHKRDDGSPFHPRGMGNGYVLAMGNKRIYIAGDTENIREMKTLKNIDIAFLPVNLPYTMTPKMAVAAAASFLPKALYPYHYGDTDTSAMMAALKTVKGVDVRLRKMP